MPTLALYTRLSHFSFAFLPRGQYRKEYGEEVTGRRPDNEIFITKPLLVQDKRQLHYSEEVTKRIFMI